MTKQFELEKIVKDWYFSNPNVTLKDASDEFNIAYDTIRDWSDRGGWTTKREGLATIEMTAEVKDQADAIRNVIFQKIVLGELEAKDLSELVKSWKSMAAITTQNTESEEFIDRDELTELLGETD